MRPNSGILSGPRITTLLVSVLVALCSGTNYVYSAYGPQLGARLGLTHTQQNIVGLSGNMGVYSSGPFIGRLVDARGPKIPLSMALFLSFFGYFGIKLIFDAGTESPISVLGLVVLIFCNFITGVGGNGGLLGSCNAVAKSFPDKYRTTTTGFVLSGFGLSAFLFSTIAHGLFPGNTSDFLLVLAIGTSVPTILGWFFIRPVPLPEADGFATLESSGEDSPSTIFERENTSHTRLLTEDRDVSSDVFADDVQFSPSVEHARRRSHSHSLSFGENGAKLLIDGGSPDVSGKALLAAFDFWLLVTITSLLSGAGIMWINNVGSIVQALLAKDSPDYDDVESSKWQSVQVSTISVMNCAGRICIGIIADYAKNRFGLRRTYCISLVAFLFLTSQLIAIQIEDVQHLYKASALLGFAYGGMFGLFPTITIEWFGLAHFSQNWGTVSLAPVLGGNLFSLAFGMNLDAHSSIPASSTTTTAPSATQCLQGVECYLASLRLTIAATLLALVLAVWAGLRDHRKASVVRVVEAAEAVVWEGGED